jgi:hypothetical protein
MSSAMGQTLRFRVNIFTQSSALADFALRCLGMPHFIKCRNFTM